MLDRKELFEGPDDLEEIANDLLEKWQATTFRHKLRALHKWKQAVATAVYAYTEPSDIPYADMKIIAGLSTDDPLKTKYAEKIKSPVTGIRAFCFNCQGGDLAGVRNCTNAICPLFPFRMGKNVFFGKLADADAAPTEDYEEVEQDDGN